MPSCPIGLLERYSGTASGIGASAGGDVDIDVPSLRAALAHVPDPRAKRGVRYPLPELLLVFVGAVFSGAKSLTMIAEWARDAARTGKLFTCGRVPSVATIHRMAARIDPDILDGPVTDWTRTQAPSATTGKAEVIAVDGKEVRGAKNGAGTRVFLMDGLDHDTGAVIGQESIGDKTNEIPPLHPSP